MTNGSLAGKSKTEAPTPSSVQQGALTNALKQAGASGKESAMTKRNFPTGDTLALKQLRDRVGTLEAAKLIGISKAQFSKDVQSETTRLAYCLAARYHLSRLDKQDHGTCIAVLFVPGDKRAALDAVLQAMGLEVKYVVK